MSPSPARLTGHGIMAGDSPDRGGFDEILSLLSRLHRAKDEAYGDAWRKRGEVLGIFANIARKFDRLQVGRSELTPAPTETLGDTAGDLCVYAGKYLTWLAEMQPEAFASASGGLDPTVAAATAGTCALDAIFAHLHQWEEFGDIGAPGALDVAWTRLTKAFSELEAGMMAQASCDDERTDRRLSNEAKTDLAWQLCDASAWLLTHLGQQDDLHVQSLRQDVGRLESES